MESVGTSTKSGVPTPTHALAPAALGIDLHRSGRLGVTPCVARSRCRRTSCPIRGGRNRKAGRSPRKPFARLLATPAKTSAAVSGTGCIPVVRAFRHRPASAHRRGPRVPSARRPATRPPARRWRLDPPRWTSPSRHVRSCPGGQSISPSTSRLMRLTVRGHRVTRPPQRRRRPVGDHDDGLVSPGHDGRLRPARCRRPRVR